MNYSICYVFRKPNPKYKSIEGLFDNLEKIVGLKFKTSSVRLKFAGGSLKTIWSNLNDFTKENDNIYHITGDVHYMALVTGRKSILTIHDVQSVVNRTFLKRFYLKLFWFWLPALVVKRITVISNFTKNELENLVPFAKNKIRVVPNPVNDQFCYSDYQFNTSLPRILLFGTKPNKNLERVLRALNGILCEIVVIGELTANQKTLLNSLKLNLSAKFNLSLDEVIEEYIACDMLCFISTYEGFGMPIIEAQAIGRPVVTSNLGAMKEVAVDSALLVDPYDIEVIRAGIIEVIEDEQLRNRLVQEGLLNANRFKAKTIAQDYLKIYEEVRGI